MIETVKEILEIIKNQEESYEKLEEIKLFKEKFPDLWRKIKIKEATDRMKKLNLYSQIIKEFEKDQGLVQYSEPTPFGGILYWIKNNPEWMDMVGDFEHKYHSLVYHAVHSYTECGEMLSLLYVSDNPEEWCYDNDVLPYNYVGTYTINLTYPEFSEFGGIVVKPIAGGLVRVE